MTECMPLGIICIGIMPNGAGCIGSGHKVAAAAAAACAACSCSDMLPAMVPGTHLWPCNSSRKRTIGDKSD